LTVRVVVRRTGAMVATPERDGAASARTGRGRERSRSERWQFLSTVSTVSISTGCGLRAGPGTGSRGILRRRLTLRSNADSVPLRPGTRKTTSDQDNGTNASHIITMR